MKRTPIKRKTPLRTKRRVVARPPRRTKRAGSDPAYLARVRLLPCCAPYERVVGGPLRGGELKVCSGRIHAHHAGRKPGTGLKANDLTAIPLCAAHHMEWHSGTNTFRGWTKEQRREWSDERIAETQRQLGLVKESA